MSFFGFSDSRNRSWATISEAIWSSTSPVTKTIRSRSRREKMSKLRSPRLVCSTTTGTRAASGSIMRISSFIVERRAENRRAGPSGALHRRQCGGFQGGNRAGRFGKRIAGQLRSVRGSSPAGTDGGDERAALAMLAVLDRRPVAAGVFAAVPGLLRSEEHTSELQSLMRISYAVFCLKKTKKKHKIHRHNTHKNKT